MRGNDIMTVLPFFFFLFRYMKTELHQNYIKNEKKQKQRQENSKFKL
jgi:hypothetical protein